MEDFILFLKKNFTKKTCKFYSVNLNGKIRLRKANYQDESYL